ncbi:MAG: Ferrochelatase [Myxococcota bacterium]|nr:Ferrochelatase [Myxococcota bacterium]
MTQPHFRTAILLLNLGTPTAPESGPVRAYLEEFLSDPRVLDIPAPARWALLNLVILPRRPAASAEAYRKIWTPLGSPLLVEGHKLTRALRREMPNTSIELAMRYGQPSIPSVMERLMRERIDRLIVAPLYPQYSSASTGSSLERVMDLIRGEWNIPAISVLPPFYDHPAFIAAWKDIAGPLLHSFQPDHVLLSYHGLPERHVRKSDPTRGHCLVRGGCCDAITADNQYCYRAQCFSTSRALKRALELEAAKVTVCFQSRLTRDPWLTPFTDKVLEELPARGVKRLAVLCPAFVADCLETLEEIGMRARDDFRAAGGEDLMLTPSLNDHPSWVRALAQMLREI